MHFLLTGKTVLKEEEIIKLLFKNNDSKRDIDLFYNSVGNEESTQNNPNKKDDESGHEEEDERARPFHAAPGIIFQ